MTAKGHYYDGGTLPPVEAEIWLVRDLLHIRLADGTVLQYPLSAFTHHNTQNGILELKTGKFPFQSVKIQDEEVAEAVRQTYQSKKSSFVEIPTRAIVAGLLGLGVIFIAALIWFYFNGLPWIAEKTTRFIPIEKEISIGKTLLQQNLLQEKIDSARSKKLQAFADAIQLDNQVPLHFTVVESETVNAYALPGGYVVVYTGLLDKLPNYAALSALLGHEVSHVNKRHALRSLVRNVSGSVLMAIVFGDYNFAGGQLEELRSLSFSRELETEADNFGMEILKKNKIPASGMTDLFMQLKKAGGDAPAEFLSTHPMTENRLKNAEGKEWPTIAHANLDSLFNGLKGW